MKEFKFWKAPNGTWWMDLPEYIKNGGDPRDLQMVCGADDFVESLDENVNEFKLQLTDKKIMSFPKNFDQLKRCDEIPTISGKYYFDDRSDLLMWFHNSITWAFDRVFPETIYYKKLRNEIGTRNSNVDNLCSPDTASNNSSGGLEDIQAAIYIAPNV